MTAISPTEILRQLVAIPSVSTLSNRPIINLVRDFLQPIGWHLHEFPYYDSAGTEKVNCIAIPGHSEINRTDAGYIDPTRLYMDLALVCHTDTVPYPSTWGEATELTSRSQSLHGRGACDVKGSLACILSAILSLGPRGTSGNIGLVLTADEEIGCVGATRLLDAHVLTARRALICEPTSLRPATAGKGYGLAEIIVSGCEAHSAFPNRGASAITTAAKLIVAIEEWLLQREGPTNPLFDPSVTTCNIGRIVGGTAKNIIPGECRFLFEWRPVPNEDPRALAQELLDFLRLFEQRNQHQNGGCRIEGRIQRAEAGFESTPGPLATALIQYTQRSPIGIAFGSEATRFARIAREVVVAGPGDMQTAHSDRECVPVAELNEWTVCLRQLLAPRT